MSLLICGETGYTTAVTCSVIIVVGPLHLSKVEDSLVFKLTMNQSLKLYFSFHISICHSISIYSSIMKTVILHVICLITAVCDKKRRLRIVSVCWTGRMYYDKPADSGKETSSSSA